MRKNYPKWIDEYTKSIHRLLRGMDLRTIEPLDCFHFHPLYSDLWFEHIHEAIDRFEKKNLDFSKATEAFPNPSSIRAMIEFLVVHYNNMVRDRRKIDKEEIKEVMNFFVRVLKAKNKRDIFAFQENIGHLEQDINQMVKKIEWQRGTPEISRALGKIYLGASSLVNGLMTDWGTDNGIEVWGPYNVSKHFGPNTALIIRDFPRLRPVELWPSAKKYRYKEIKVYAIYKNIKMQVQFVSCHTIFQGNLAKNLIKYALVVDGKYIKMVGAIEKISSYYLKLAQEQYKRVRKLNFEALKQKILAQELYQLKDFFQLIGIDIKPPVELRKRVRGRKLLRNRYPLDTTGMTLKEIDHRFGIDNLKRLYSE